MKVIYLTEPYDPKKIDDEAISLAMGFFDGVHLGHQKVILKAKQKANEKKIKLAVMTFDKHPSVQFQKKPERSIKYLTSMEKKISLMEGLGVDIFYILTLNNDLASLTPQDFVTKYMIDLHAQVVVAGFDYTYGKKDIANMDTLAKYAHQQFEVVTVPELISEDQKISSTRIRAAIDKGQINDVNRLLGYEYQTIGEVVHGEARGRELGFPTLNLEFNEHIRIPGPGIYVTRVQVSGVWYRGMASIGYNVTFGQDRELTVEINLFDFNEMIYGQQVTVEWLSYLRSEIKFDGIDGLISQLNQDKKMTNTYFN
ncbi:riboflavin biosynthesis protein RibF [Dellaglioa algida]|uniref:riboflavin biosynthesis protein RibF n=1 Tax=Dellaglioa algida TaxID=105612 RepID=UPI000BC74B4C|nr:riboflavin biosynthesis protein RibF [Dellaglioa algida]MDK1718120.1 riboflavin biosynthesis protein RibF [Dellaglioa algida]MDK1727632.1 riboflavin biosynthesis protein RibF [Dellaglioa algida]MDK1729111.1 riboflavin biosynthesis protein RibF [Dellaglioa algida]MDK1735242.1 riboflavin biosynthesis protein RibF [Dellaglioa algida]MDK1741545.1 riboflavin biosynthesis protein RibF [Dellaglioa algida]